MTGFVVQGHKCHFKQIAKWKSIFHAENYNAVILNSKCLILDFCPLIYVHKIVQTVNDGHLK